MEHSDNKEKEQEKHLESLRVNPNMTGSLQANRQILSDAGFSPTIIKKAVRRLNDALDANKVRLAVSNGVVVASKETPDYDNRLKACNLVFNLAGVSKQEDASGKIGTVNVQIINYGKPNAT